MSQDSIYKDPQGNIISEYEWTERVNNALLRTASEYVNKQAGDVKPDNSKVNLPGVIPEARKPSGHGRYSDPTQQTTLVGN